MDEEPKKSIGAANKILIIFWIVFLLFKIADFQKINPENFFQFEKESIGMRGNVHASSSEIAADKVLLTQKNIEKFSIKHRDCDSFFARAIPNNDCEYDHKIIDSQQIASSKDYYNVTFSYKENTVFDSNHYPFISSIFLAILTTIFISIVGRRMNSAFFLGVWTLLFVIILSIILWLIGFSIGASDSLEFLGFILLMYDLFH